MTQNNSSLILSLLSLRNSESELIYLQNPTKTHSNLSSKGKHLKSHQIIPLKEKQQVGVKLTL